ncbi:MAG TPA: nitrilase-related carbon-nitrogen hydrolase, partial [Actinomycetota bacterium]|nr:nitrilase-related carbon-nitrogen hydrolase [Actinomycetota bacterium]
MERLRLAGAQINPVVGDLDGNVERVLAAYREAADLGAHLVVFPELAVTGYPPEDLVFKPSFLTASRAALHAAAAGTGETAAVIGFVEPTPGGPANAAALCHQGRVLATYRKMLLPNYGVFDEERYFVPGAEVLLAGFGRVE